MTVDIILLVASLFVAAFAAAGETAMTASSELRLRTLSEDGSHAARRVLHVKQRKEHFLGTVLLLNDVALIVAGQATVLIAFDQFPNISEVIFTIALAFVSYELCELVPKSLVLIDADRAAMTLSPLVVYTERLLRPVVTGGTSLARLMVRVIARGRSVPGPFLTEREVKMVVTVGEEVGVVEPEERQMIHGVLELTDKVAREVMVPRVDVVGVEVSQSVDEVVRRIIQSGHSRIPVYEDTMDNVVGVVYAKDVLRSRATREVSTVQSLARRPYFTPEAKRAGELLVDMRAQRVHMAIVVDEYGGTAGIVTIEDLLEEIVGEIRDEYDVAEKDEIEFISDREVLMNARVALDEMNALLHLDLDLDTIDADTLGGLVYERLGEIPRAGDTVRIGEMTLTVEGVRRQSIRSVRISSPTPFHLDRALSQELEERGINTKGARTVPETPSADAASHGGGSEQDRQGG